MTHQSLQSELTSFFHNGSKNGMTDKEMQTFVPNMRPNVKWVYFAVILPILIAILFNSKNYFQDWKDETINAPCLIEKPSFFSELIRPLANCSMICDGLESTPVKANLSPKEFLREHAYVGRPVLVVNSTHNWTALNTFSFDFFKKLYYTKPDEIDDRQFFAYKSSYNTLSGFLAMSKDRQIKMDWYVGWGDDDKETMSKLREHYQRPSFLPEGSESSLVNWIFIGGTGPGANIHIDNVNKPSWQAQIKGKKTWFLYPPPECEHVCKPLNMTMNPGDIVVVDTNVWYHSTYVHPGELSITIGSEYD